MNLRFVVHLAIALAALICPCRIAFAQTPQGPPLPISTFNRSELHTEAQFGYLMTGEPYRFQGEFGGDTNLLAIGRDEVYGLADVDVDALNRGANGKTYQPDRLRGTFEVGYRLPVERDSASLYVRHQSSHDIDQTTSIDDTWNEIGARYDWRRPKSVLTASAGYFYSVDQCNYRDDIDVQWFVDRGYLLRHQVQWHADIRYVGESGGAISGFVDYAITPSVRLTEALSLYLTYCQVHDMTAPNGPVETPLIVGFMTRT